MRRHPAPGTSVNTGSDGREQLLQAARTSLATRGYDDVGLRDIASAAGVKVGRVVRAFGSKQAVLEAVLDASLAGPARTPGRWTAAIARELVTARAGRALEPWMLLVLAGSSATSAPTVQARLPDFLALLSDRLVGSGQRELRAATAMAVLVGMVVCGRLLHVVPVAGPPSRVTRRFVEAALDMIEAGGPRITHPSHPPASGNRAKVIAAADAVFSRAGYDHASVRAIAAEARIDPAQLLRSFGSKESLFLAVLKAHFVSHVRAPPWWEIRASLLRSLEGSWTPLEITLRSATSPVAGPIIRRDMLARFIGPYAEALPAPHAELRAGLAISVMIGIAFCRDVLGVSVLRTRHKALLPYVAALLCLVESGDGIFGTRRRKP
jgi:AcrR family transcriptional regulator